MIASAFPQNSAHVYSVLVRFPCPLLQITTAQIERQHPVSTVWLCTALSRLFPQSLVTATLKAAHIYTVATVYMFGRVHEIETLNHAQLG